MELTRKMLMLMMIQIRFTSPFLNPISQDTDQSSLSLQWTNSKKKKKTERRYPPSSAASDWYLSSLCLHLVSIVAGPPSLALLNSCRPHKNNFAVLKQSAPPFGFYCCWPSIARSAKFLQTTQKQFRSAQTKCANMIT
jgi:hypothetical protein